MGTGIVYMRWVAGPLIQDTLTAQAPAVLFAALAALGGDNRQKRAQLPVIWV